MNNLIDLIKIWEIISEKQKMLKSVNGKIETVKVILEFAILFFM